MAVNILGNAYRDQCYSNLFKHIQDSRAALEELHASPQVSLWDSETAACIDTAAVQNGYRSYRRITTKPELYVVGYEQASLDNMAAFFSTLGEKDILEQCAVLSEGYDGEAVMISKARPVTNRKLNAVFERYDVVPQGKDSFLLRERQYKSLQEIAQSQHAAEKKVLEAMGCLVKREKDYFVPAILEQKNKGKSVIFLTNLVHVLSSTFPIALNNKEIKYAFFVPSELRK